MAEKRLIGFAKVGDLTRIVVVGLADRYEKAKIKRTIKRHNCPSLCFALPCSASPCNKDHDSPSAVLEKAPEEVKKGPSFNVEGYLIGKVKQSWVIRFGKAQFPNMKRFLWRCQARGISPLVVFDYAKQHFRETPLQYVQSLMAKGKGMWPDDGDGTYLEWEGGLLERRAAAGDVKPTQGVHRVGDLVRR
jgi:hypothetical protein